MRLTPSFESGASGASRPVEAASGPATVGFDHLGLAPALCEAIRAAGYREPTPIQREAIPHVLAGRDVLGCAQTGTGKTAAFALPILHRLLAAPRGEGRPVIRALVLAPTRELAAQIGESFRHYGARSRLRHCVVFGGVGKHPQIEALRRGVDVLVATPGRLLDLLEGRHAALGRVEHLVLDEADRMLDMGFIHDVRRIAREVPGERQTLLFSATLPREIQQLAGRLLVDPVRVAVDPIASTCEPIEQSVYFVDTGRKLDLLLALLRGGEVDRALVFTRTKRGANRLADQLERARVAVAAIHGNKSQPARERALEGFKRGSTRVVVATDIAARGIDVKGLSHVINFDLPQDPESYVHRVGRTGRAGATGVALTLCSAGERPLLLAIERLTRRRLERRETPAGLASEPRRELASGERRQGEAAPAAPRRREAAPGARRRPQRSAGGRSQRGRRW
jgi:ATP-dependent RNA helicase RhlE